MSNHYATLILEALTQLTSTFAPLKSVEYYEAICRYTVEHFDFDYAFVGELDSISKSIHAVCGWSKERAIKPFHYMKQHRDFSGKVVGIRNALKAGNLIEKDELIEFLIHWLIHHINHTDKKLGSFLQTQIAHQ